MAQVIYQMLYSTRYITDVIYHILARGQSQILKKIKKISKKVLTYNIKYDILNNVREIKKITGGNYEKIIKTTKSRTNRSTTKGT